MADEQQRGADVHLGSVGIHASIGVLLGDARVAAGMSQSEVAKRLSVAQSRIAKLELGTRRLLYVEAVQLAALYGVGVTAFDPRAAHANRVGRRPRVDRRASRSERTTRRS